jgi:hypothetical protein
VNVIQTFEANIGAEGVVKVVRYCDYLAEVRRLNREMQEEIRDTVRGAQDEATWQQIQGDDYGSY